MKTNNRVLLWMSPCLMALLTAGCSGFEPYEPRDHREDGPQRGFLSGEDGQFVISIGRSDHEPEIDVNEDPATNDTESHE
jgi:hypothetical protein